MTREVITARRGSDFEPVLSETRGLGSRSDSPPILLVVLQRRWWLLALCSVIAGGAAFAAAKYLGADSSRIEAQMLYNGLPMPPGPRVYDPPSLETYREILFSTSSMQTICDKHGLGVPPAAMKQFYSSKVARGSSILGLSLTWADTEDGIDILNDTMDLLVDEAASRRVRTLREHMKHVEVAQLTARNKVDDATERLRLARERQQTSMSNGGIASSKHASALEKVNSAQAAIDDKRVELTGMAEQMTRLNERYIAAEKTIRERILSKVQSAIHDRARQYPKDSDRWVELAKLFEGVKALAKDDSDGSQEGSQTVAEWKASVAEIISDELSIESLDLSDVTAAEGRLAAIAGSRDKLEMSMIPTENQLDLLIERKKQYEDDANALAEDVTSLAASDVEDYQRALESAEGRLNLLDQQLENMRQLEKSRTREFSVTVPASMETTVTTSNRKKLFVMFFALAASVLAAPVFLVEWLRERENPVEAFSNRLSIPVITERLLKGPVYGEPAMLRDDATDAIRMLALRIQQSISSQGGVVLFSSVGKAPPPLHLISAVAECLAEREERVLLVDAVDPARGTSLLTIGDDSHPSSPRKAPGANVVNAMAPAEGAARAVVATENSTRGLAELFSRECEGVDELIQPTSCPGVDLISRGHGSFPREAMASSCMTELFDHCRGAYTKILVAGPSTSSDADLQMMAARADGLLFAANNASVKEPEAMASVRELIELQAPIIGVVA